MNIQEEVGVGNPVSDRSGVVDGKNNSAMRCANPKCSKELLYLREGSLQLLALEPDSDNQFSQDDGAFATKPLRSRFFWLCGECSKTHIVKQWTTSGIVLVLRNQEKALPVVPPLPPMADPLHRSELLVLRRSSLDTKVG
jgi:hypothetical protein